jgi:hypothetical protein
MPTIFCLVKFGKKIHLEEMFETGKIRFGLITEFMQSSENERGDKFEGVFEIINTGFTEVTCEHPTLGTQTFKLNPDNPARLMQRSLDPHCSFSCYALTYEMFAEIHTHNINERLLEFGDYAIFIKNPKEFINRVHRELSDVGYSGQTNLINYIDYETAGTITPDFFTKSDQFSHQNELRFLFETKEEKPVFIEIGSISDISVLLPAAELVKNPFVVKRKSNQ